MRITFLVFAILTLIDVAFSDAANAEVAIAEVEAETGKKTGWFQQSLERAAEKAATVAKSTKNAVEKAKYSIDNASRKLVSKRVLKKSPKRTECSKITCRATWSLIVDMIEAPVETIKTILSEFSWWPAGGFKFNNPCSSEVLDVGPKFAKSEIGYEVSESTDELIMTGLLCLF